MAQDETHPRAPIVSARRTLRMEGEGLRQLELALDATLGERLIEAVEALFAVSGRVIVTGMGKSGHVARKIAATLASTGTPAHFVHPAEASHGDLGMIRQEDAILALSWSGETAELADIVAHSRRFSVRLIAITSRQDATLAREADIALILPAAEEACPNRLAPTTSTTMMLALGDALAVALLERRGFTAQDFHQFHPGGKLGAQLMQVRQVMKGPAQLPLVGDDALMSAAVLEISGKGFGCVGVVDPSGALVGVITDGDLRRAMRPELLGLPATAVMTRNPKTIEPDALVVEAVERMNRLKITALFVDGGEGKPVGLVHMHDLLAIGAA
jgi:arabinose-5-phosphate isomerase